LYLGKIGRRWLATVAAVFWSLIFFEFLFQSIVLLPKFCIELFQAFNLIDQLINNDVKLVAHDPFPFLYKNERIRYYHGLSVFQTGKVINKKLEAKLKLVLDIFKTVKIIWLFFYLFKWLKY